MQIEEARLIIEKEELQDGYLYVPFIHILNYEGIILEKVNEGYRVCRRSVSERDCESDYDAAVFRNEEEALEDFIIKLRELNELRKATARYYEKQRKKSELDRLTVKISIIVLILVGILGLVKLLS